MTVAEWIHEYQINLGITNRYITMKKALEILTERGGKTIVETGCVRMKDDWGAGMSTFVFGSYAKQFDAHLHTVDISQENIQLCKEVTKQFADNITYTVMDSISYLAMFKQKIDLLYLDSMDCPIEDDESNPLLIASQIHQRTELETALPKMAEHGLILLDDNDFKNGGKTRLSKEFLADRGATEVLSEKQSLWIL